MRVCASGSRRRSLPPDLRKHRGHLRHLPLVRRERLASLTGTPPFTGRLEAAGGLPPDAIACHAEPGEVMADPRAEVEVGQGVQPEGAPVSWLPGQRRFKLWLSSH
jgi:hypothetical protein